MEADFELLENALPRGVRPLLDLVESLLVRGRTDPKLIMI